MHQTISIEEANSDVDQAEEVQVEELAMIDIIDQDQRGLKESHSMPTMLRNSCSSSSYMN